MKLIRNCQVNIKCCAIILHNVYKNKLNILKDVYSLAQAVAETTNTSEPVLFNHLSCIIAGWKGSGKTTVMRLLESERWDDVFEDKDIGCTISSLLHVSYNFMI